MPNPTAAKPQLRWPLVAFAVGACLAFATVLPSTSSEAGVGAIYFTDGVAATNDFADCAESLVYNTTTTAPTGAASQKAYLGRKIGVLGCATVFEHVVASDLALQGAATARFWVGCDVASVGLGSAATTSIRLNLTKNNVTLSFNVNWVAPSNLCQAGTITPVEASLNTQNATLKAGDKLALRLLFFYLNPEPSVAKNLHILVGSTTHPSSVSGIGFPTGSPANTTAPPATTQSPTPTNSTANTTAPPTSTTTPPTTTVNSTAGGPKESRDADTPGLGILGVAAASAVGLVVVARRRR